MENIELLKEFFGWCTILNFVVLLVASMTTIFFKKSISKMHRQTTELEGSVLNEAYFNYLANYKIGFLIFNLVPYLTQSIMTLQTF